MTTADQTKTQTAKSEGKTMTTNKKFLKYNELLERNAKLKLELQSVQARQEELRKEQSELILDKLKSFQHISRAVFRKYFPGPSVMPAEKGQELLGKHGWIFATIQLKEVDLKRITLSKMKYHYGKESGWKEESTLTVPRELLHMSDRDFAKLIRTQIQQWKKLRQATEKTQLETELKRAEKEAQSAAQKLEEIQKKLKSKNETEVERQAKREARRAKYEESQRALTA